jgi:hypothetical protein
VTGKKRTAREPLWKCRKRRDDVKTVGELLSRDQAPTKPARTHHSAGASRSSPSDETMKRFLEKLLNYSSTVLEDQLQMEELHASPVFCEAYHLRHSTGHYTAGTAH